MIYKNHDELGKVQAYIVYYQINKDKKLDENGEYIYVEDVWVHESVRKTNILKLAINCVIPLFSKVKYLYWVRHKYGDRMSLYEVNRDNGIKLIKKEI
jgi:hypothetical protein